MAWSKEQHAAYYSEWAARNKDKLRTNSARWREKNRELARERARPHQAAKGGEYALRYRAKHRGRRREQCSRYRATQLRATPAWADAARIAEVYAKAAELQTALGVALHVDHEIPLQGRRVCGLHVHTNLRIVTASENCAKGNRT